MKTITTFDKFKWLVKRELWEHKVAFVWTPVVVCSALVVIIFAVLLKMLATGEKSASLIVIGSTKVTTTALDVAHGAIAYTYATFASIAAFAVGFCVFFYCLNALYDERKDRSELFWRSLPLSDSTTVLSKVAVAIGVGPLIALAVAVCSAILTFAMGILGGVSQGESLLGLTLLDSMTWLAPLYLLAILPVAATWALPTIGWLLMMSAAVRSRPAVWAIGVPLLVGVLVSFANRFASLNFDTAWVWKHVVGRLLGSTMPGGWFSSTGQLRQVGTPNKETSMTEMLAQSWHSFSEPNIWIGAIVGIAMIYAAIQLRRWRDEG